MTSGKPIKAILIEALLCISQPSRYRCIIHTTRKHQAPTTPSTTPAMQPKASKSIARRGYGYGPPHEDTLPNYEDSIAPCSRAAGLPMDTNWIHSAAVPTLTGVVCVEDYDSLPAFTNRYTVSHRLPLICLKTRIEARRVEDQIVSG